MKFSSYLKNLDTRDYMPGFIAAKRAIKKGHKIAILTARANKIGHEPLIKQLEKKLGVRLDRKLVFFVTDMKFPIRYNSTARKKLYVLLELLKKYDKIKFFDDEIKNTAIVNKFSRAAKIYPKLKAYGMHDYDVNKLKEEVNRSSGNVLSVFDLDGTMWKIPSSIRIVNKKTNQLVKILSQEEWAKHNAKYGYDLSMYGNDSDLTWDFSDFRNYENIKNAVKEKGNIFKK